MQSVILCNACNVGRVSAFRFVGDGRRLWVCHECDAVWLGDTAPEGHPDGTLYQYVQPYQGPGTPTDWEQIEPVTD